LPIAAQKVVLLSAEKLVNGHHPLVSASHSWPPANPPTQLAGSPAPQISEITAPQISEINRQHLEQQRIFKTYTRVDQAIRSQIITAVPDVYI
jgi:hypothetical protein